MCVFFVCLGFVGLGGNPGANLTNGTNFTNGVSVHAHSHSHPHPPTSAPSPPNFPAHSCNVSAIPTAAVSSSGGSTGSTAHTGDSIFTNACLSGLLPPPPPLLVTSRLFHQA